jgi:hypothetical protein
MIKLLQARYLNGFRFELTFSDGSEGVFDLSAYLATREGPLLAALADEAFACRAFIEAGALCWPNGLELSAQRLHDPVLLELVVPH